MAALDRAAMRISEVGGTGSAVLSLYLLQFYGRVLISNGGS